MPISDQKPSWMLDILAENSAKYSRVFLSAVAPEDSSFVQEPCEVQRDFVSKCPRLAIVPERNIEVRSFGRQKQPVIPHQPWLRS